MEQNMQYIYQIYLDGSFTKAAERLYLTQPALSMAVRQEEKNLGAVLFDRSSRPLTLTPAGEAYIRTIEQMKYLENDLERELADLRDIRTGRLHIGGTHYLNCYILAEVLAGFSRTYPGIQIEVSEDSSARLARLLEKQDVDLIFSCASELIDRFEHRPAFYDYILLAVPQNLPTPQDLAQCAMSAKDIQAKHHLSPTCPKVPLDRFRELEFILLQKGNNLYDRSTRMFASAGFSPRVKMELSQLVTAYRFAEKGMGATFVSDRIVQALSSENLILYSIDSPEADRLFYALTPQRNYTAYAVKAFIEYTLEQFGTTTFSRKP